MPLADHDFAGLTHVASGKVREIFEVPGDPDALLMVASDRISAFDVILPTEIPDKGAVLTGISLWWFERLTLDIYATAAALAEKQGIILADTKVEFGHDKDGVLRLGDEVLTPDSSRFWPADTWEPGRAQPSYDKQYVRDWLIETGNKGK